MAKKNFTWNLDIDTVSKIQILAKKEHRSVTNYVEHLLMEKVDSEEAKENEVKTEEIK